MIIALRNFLSAADGVPVGTPGGAPDGTPEQRPPPVAALVPAMLILMAIIVPISVLILQPFVGAFVRWRAHYAPIGVDLDGHRTIIGPRLTSLWGTLRRTKRLEGWKGLYKGWVVNVIIMTMFGLLYTGVFAAAVAHAKSANDLARVSQYIIIGLILLAPLYIPADVILTRAIVTPYVLPSSIMGALRVILTPYERRRPWVLWKPLFVPTALLTLSALAVISVVRAVVVIKPDGSFDVDQNPWRFVGVIALGLVSTAWVNPLVVAIAKLQAQPNYGLGPDGRPKTASEEAEALLPAEGLERCGLAEDVITLRTDAEPYNGLFDTFRKIKNEEGAAALYRTWFWTALANVMSVGG